MCSDDLDLDPDTNAPWYSSEFDLNQHFIHDNVRIPSEQDVFEIPCKADLDNGTVFNNNILGKTITLNGKQVNVVGYLPDGRHVTTGSDLQH